MSEYCCDKFKKICEEPCGHSPFDDKDGKWQIMWRIDFDNSGCDYQPIKYCPFCGKKLKAVAVTYNAGTKTITVTGGTEAVPITLADIPKKLLYKEKE